MADVLDEHENAGDTWKLKKDAIGRLYGHHVGAGKVSVETYNRSKRNTQIHDHE